MTALNYTADYPIDAMGFRLEGMAFDGCHYYFSVFCDNIILKYDCDFEMIRKIETDRIYSCICYDYKENCFWAGSKKHYGCIFKLNCRFTEIDRIDLGCELCGAISGLSYNCGDDSLLIAVADRVLKLTKYNRRLQAVFSCPKCYVTGVLSLSPGILITLLKNGHQYTYIIKEDEKQDRILSAPPCFLINSMIIGPCSSEDSVSLSVLATKSGRYPYILTVKLSPCSLGYKPDCCNFCICQKCCDGCRIDECCGKENILESIAREEAALSHILNAEGEKLQKTLESTDDIDKILCVNKEINETLVNVTHLEHVLYAKLHAIEAECLPCDHRPCCPPDDKGEI